MALINQEVLFEITPIRSGGNQTEFEKISFKPFFETISDRFSPNWEGQKDIGRADSRWMYAEFNRYLNISFKVIAEGDDLPKAKDAFKKLNDLAKATYPYYTDGKGFSGVFIKFTIGGLYKNEFGFINSLDYDWDNNVIWDLEDQLPMYTTANLSITYIGKVRPDLGYGVNPFSI